MKRLVPWLVVAGVALGPISVPARASGNGNGNGNGNGHRPRNFYDLTGSADWEVFRSEGTSGGAPSTFEAIRQQYSIDVVGSIWDFRFNRFALGIDLYRDDREANGEKTDWSGVGYRATTTFFPNRPFPLRLFARRSTIDSTGAALADNDRETAAWGVEWTVATRKQRNARVQYDNTSYDLLSPVALRERNDIGTVEFSQRFRRRQTEVRYGYSDRREEVRDTRFVRHDIRVSDRTRFDNGMTLLVNANHVMSDARFSTGATDDLTQDRFTARYDVPMRRRVGFDLGYDFNDNDGRFLVSTSHSGNAQVRIRIGRHWETVLGSTVAAVTTRVEPATEIRQDTTATRAGLRYNQNWSRLVVSAAYTFGLARTRFDVEPDRTLTNHAADLDLGVPFGKGASWHGSVTVRQDENDVSGIGYTYDEILSKTGIEGGIGDRLKADVSVYGRDTTYDTFQFGVQESREYGVQATLGADRGSVSLTVSTREGISEFVPDPGAGGPFVPGADLENRADIVTGGAHVRLGRRASFRVQVRHEDREYTSIGRETVVSYNPEVEWRPGVWRIIFGASHYERDNSTAFDRDTIRLKLGRRFF